MTDPFASDEQSVYGQYICDNVNELDHDSRVEVMQMIFRSASRDKITEKGNGVPIKLTDIPEPLIKDIYTFIDKKIKEQSFILDL